MHQQHARYTGASAGSFEALIPISLQGAVVGILALSLLLTGITLLDTSMPAWSLVLLLGALLLVDWLTPPGDATSRAETPVFAVIVAAAVLLNPIVAASFAMLTILTANLFRSSSAAAVPDLLRALLAAGMVGIGTAVMHTPQVVPLLFVFWICFIGYWLIKQRGNHNSQAVRRHGYMLGWIMFMLAMPLYLPLVPADLNTFIAAGVPALHFAVGFMTADTALVTGIGYRRDGVAGLWFWLRELVPTFTRYNIMAVAGFALASIALVYGMVGMSLAITALFAMFLIVREREISHRRLVSTVCVLASALEARDSYTKGHADRVSAYAIAVAERLGWSGRARRDLELAAHLHDIGKVGVPDEVLLKPGRFTDDDFAIMKQHSAIGSGIVLNSPEVRHVAPIVRQHHERMDGSGYPDGLHGDEITAAARILGVADAFDAMTSNRPYRNAMDEPTALGIIHRARGTEFEPAVVDALFEIVEEGSVDVVLEYGYCLTH